MEPFLLAITVVIAASLIYFLKGPLLRLSRHMSYYILVITVLLLVVSIVIYPKESVEASYNGLMTWFTIVLPSLLPFFVGAEMLIGLGVVRFIGALLEPIMRPLFNVPGEGSFAFAMSITSGYPVGVKIAGRLRQEGSITRGEAQRMVAFCSTSGPLFILGAVGVGMFESPQVGVALAICHYLAAIFVGLIFRFYKRRDCSPQTATSSRGVIRTALRQLRICRQKSLPLGTLMGNAVKEAINTILVVGGFIIVFSVVIRVFQLTGLISFFSELLYFLFKSFNFDIAVYRGLITGFFEITMGSKLISEVSQAGLQAKLAAVSFIIAWSGFSIHAQSFSILNQTDIKPSIYVLSKLLHGLLSAISMYLLYPFFAAYYKFPAAAGGSYSVLSPLERIFENFKLSIELFLAITIVLLLIAIMISFLSSLFAKKKK